MELESRADRALQKMKSCDSSTYRSVRGQVRHELTRCKHHMCGICMKSGGLNSPIDKKAQADVDSLHLDSLTNSDALYVTLDVTTLPHGSDFHLVNQAFKKRIKRALQGIQGLRLIGYSHLSDDAQGGLKLHWHALVVMPGLQKKLIKEKLVGVGSRLHLQPMYEEVPLDVNALNCLRYAIKVVHSQMDFYGQLMSFESMRGEGKGRGHRIALGMHSDEAVDGLTTVGVMSGNLRDRLEANCGNSSSITDGVQVGSRMDGIVGSTHGVNNGSTMGSTVRSTVLTDVPSNYGYSISVDPTPKLTRMDVLKAILKRRTEEKRE